MIILIVNLSPYIFKTKNELEAIIIELSMQFNKENASIRKLYKKEIINYYSLFILLNYLICKIIIINYIIYFFKYYN